MAEVVAGDRNRYQRRTTREPGGVSFAAVVVSAVFAVLLITAPENLDTAWQWIRDLPIILEVVAWVLLLPWMLAYVVWQTSWALWVRIVVVAVLIGGVASSFWASKDRR
jgi:hypothetical protein